MTTTLDHHQTMTDSYLIVALTTHKGSEWTRERFEADHRENHHPRNVHHIDGISTGLRYQNLNPEAQWDTILAIYTLTNPKIIGGPESQAKRREHIEADIVSKVRLYLKLQGVRSRTNGGKGHSRFLITARMEADEVVEDELPDCFCRRHVDLLSAVEGYRRSTCWNGR